MDSVEKAVGRIEAQVDATREDVQEIKALVIQQNGRIRTLELKDAKLSGGWTVISTIGAIAGFAGGLIVNFLTR